MQYGIAIENFFRLEWLLIWTYAILSLLAIPQMAIFASQNTGSEGASVRPLFNSLSFGAFGMANVICRETVNLPLDKTPEEWKNHVEFSLVCDEQYYVSDVLKQGLVDAPSNETKT